MRESLIRATLPKLLMFQDREVAPWVWEVTAKPFVEPPMNGASQKWKLADRRQSDNGGV
jgi:hypothetical protein